VGGSFGSMTFDALLHVVVDRRGSGNETDRSTVAMSDVDGERALAAAGTSEQHGQRHGIGSVLDRVIVDQ